MSISHRGIFPGYWTTTGPYPWLPSMTGMAIWHPCSFEELVQWQ